MVSITFIAAFLMSGEYDHIKKITRPTSHWDQFNYILFSFHLCYQTPKPNPQTDNIGKEKLSFLTGITLEQNHTHNMECESHTQFMLKMIIIDGSEKTEKNIRCPFDDNVKLII